MSVDEHKQAPKRVTCAVITVSDSRNAENDKSGKLMKKLLIENGHQVGYYQIIKDEGDEIRRAIHTAMENSHIKVILLNGGTGIAKRDVTIETVSCLFEKEIVGFGELFRMLSYMEDIGSAAMLSRAIAGTYRNCIIFSTPGSTGAVQLAMEKLILPELHHVVREIEKDR
ncbi:MogA/MoaB family molybdenum cofactor biosynthesis protein [Heyndrickxia camelliae]|uniref:Molybdenum cofactor biosynthesis protein B n=1 Tax=Heyndrickxia camelliae TaxID=1707093 RepID=A0A2N3LI54_9BACI|nr:MogA/MoaB family molybdenum cofactor biosynthesis protein [Heyndrickxia camelliae]PKR84302.1 molybdenum cofactor biosynthesis protein [Heyndrickxia camelliae]